jgi:colanic acid biosynthesis glycosyl transferase WcaI
MFRDLNAVVIIRWDTEKLLLRYDGMTKDKIRFIPNWARLASGPGRRPLSAATRGPLRGRPFRQSRLYPRPGHRVRGSAPFAQRSGYSFPPFGLGDRLRENLSNASLIDRVEDGDLETFLSAANVWLIPYRKNVTGVSVPSRFYNLLTVGRPVILVSESEAEAAPR